MQYGVQGLRYAGVQPFCAQTTEILASYCRRPQLRNSDALPVPSHMLPSGTTFRTMPEAEHSHLTLPHLTLPLESGCCLQAAGHAPTICIVLCSMLSGFACVPRRGEVKLPAMLM